MSSFTSNEMEQVLEYWQDISQDIDYISKESGLDIKKVVDILEELQKKGDISGFSKIERRKIDESQILLFEELVDSDVIKSLKLDQFNKSKDKDYLFDKKEINEIYDAHIFTVTLKEIHYQQSVLIFPLIIDFKSKEYDMFMVYTPNDEVFYGSKDGESGVRKIKDALGKDNMEMLDEVTVKMLDDHIPEDFWEVRNKQN
jgi:hypothetical protein